ncbi:LigB family dioxygenase [Pseudovibrio axinellae]|uniref:LigB family dioxygenase n=1 Tax=Pseudovibrio axinellae TaxID=989403 RepID=A0A165Z2E6_9HYPH|nr:class III extradiol ring-cleavage dioxygenase [Pseudovibrio axinellae]KZL19454.1 LigB family dioxygenase [Pseudovibrio axinellae]SEQ27233.1 4,5-DOPA dioxygenase extradiol [Pseudovibrio axinellae]
MKQSSLFLPHGAPDLVIRPELQAHQFLKTVANTETKPKAILVISPHWQTERLTITSAGPLKTIHDFRGFARQLYEIEYPASTPNWLVHRVHDAITRYGLTVNEDNTRELDHGAWVPLSLAYPEADLPVLQVSLPYSYGSEESYNLGRALAPLSEEGILIIGSGAVTHNFSEVADSGDVPAWALEFDQWITRLAENGETCALLSSSNHKHYKKALPTDEHFLPLLVAYGAAGEGAYGEKLHESFTYRSISMSAFRFHANKPTETTSSTRPSPLT